MIMASHETAFAREVANQACFPEQGHIGEENRPGQIFGNPQRDRARAFLSRIIEAGRL
jgi:polar amino acid transport system ATP-binding protein